VKRRLFALKPLFTLLGASPDYLSWKFEEHRAFTVLLCHICGLTAAALWVADWVTDPHGAQRTLWLRALYVPSFSLVAWVIGRSSYRIMGLIALLGGLFVEVVFMAILNRLNGGMIWQLGGFMFFMIGGVLLFQGFSLRTNLLYTLVIAGFPQLVGLSGLAPNFNAMQYAVLIWPASMVVMIAQYAFAQNCWRRHQSERILELASNTDALTGVSNRRHFMQLLHETLARGQRGQRPVSLLMIDIDHFKRINDTHGHPTGDLVIRTVAEICRKSVREVDVVARIGGEEFAVVLADTPLSAAMVAAERIRQTVESAPMFSIGGEAFRFTVSIGGAEQSGSATINEDYLLSAADRALYAAKSGGRNCVVFPPA
jgi:diguanylate cyclase (GGDEF)-like protein